MISNQFVLDVNHELIVDNFAGGGGASTGIELALGRHVDIAVNHDPEAVAMHEANHPQTQHYCESVWDVNPREVTHGRPIGLAWFSPDCKHFSKAKGGQPRDKKIRGLAWVILRWASLPNKPRVIMIENVEEFQDWGPLLQDGKPCPKNKGRTFRVFVNALKRHGYTVDWRELRACDFGAPTIRKRLFLVARCDGRPIVWPKPTHGQGLLPYRTAAECIDWSIPCQSIFERNKPLVENTLRRIARGIMRYVIEAEEPFIVDGGKSPFTTEHANSTACAHLIKHYGGGYNGPGASLSDPLPTITTTDHNGLVTSHLVKVNGQHTDEVRAFLVKYYGNEASGVSLADPLHTVTTKDRMGLVLVRGEQYVIADIGMRMLTPRELYAAQGFPASYIIDPIVDGDQLTKTAQVRMVGNSVSPMLAKALVTANVPELAAWHPTAANNNTKKRRAAA